MISPIQLFGSVDYVSPEALSRQKITTKADIWSLGVILYILLSGYPPFFAPSNQQKQHMIMSGEFSFYEATWKNISSSAKQLISDILKVNPEMRPSAQQGEKYDIDNIRSDFEGKVFLMQIRKGYDTIGENPKNMVLVAYYEDNISTPENMLSSEKSVESSLPSLSPLKRQMSEIDITTGTPTKKFLNFKYDGTDQSQSSSS